MLQTCLARWTSTCARPSSRCGCSSSSHADPAQNAAPAKRRNGEQLMLDFQHSGMHLDDQQRTRLAELTQQSFVLASEFEAAVNGQRGGCPSRQASLRLRETDHVRAA